MSLVKKMTDLSRQLATLHVEELRAFQASIDPTDNMFPTETTSKTNLSLEVNQDKRMLVIEQSQRQNIIDLVSAEILPGEACKGTGCVDPHIAAVTDISEITLGKADAAAMLRSAGEGKGVVRVKGMLYLPGQISTSLVEEKLAVLAAVDLAGYFAATGLATEDVTIGADHPRVQLMLVTRMSQTLH